MTRIKIPETAPIPMVLHCPKCGVQHIDKVGLHEPGDESGPSITFGDQVDFALDQ